MAVVDEYLATCADALPEEHRAIVESWKRKISRRFIMERYLKRSFIFISVHNRTVYLVSGITSSWEQMLWYRRKR